MENLGHRKRPGPTSDWQEQKLDSKRIQYVFPGQQLSQLTLRPQAPPESDPRCGHLCMYTRVLMFPCRECSWCRVGGEWQVSPRSPPLSRLLSDVTASPCDSEGVGERQAEREKGQKWRGRRSGWWGETRAEETDRRLR